MSSVAVPLPLRPRLGRGSLILLVVVATAVAAGVFVWLHKDVPLPYANFRGACDRLRASGLPITDRDWFCHAVPWTARAGFVAASLLAAAAYALPCAILAAAGRRSWAFAPVVGLTFTAYPELLYLNEPAWWQGTWPGGRVTGAALTMLLVVLPAAVIVFLRRTPATPRRRVSLIAAAATTTVCGLGLLPLRSITDALFERHFEAIGGTIGSSLLWPAVVMCVFAAILGPDRRWWPWSLVPTAFLLSFGPSFALMVGGERLHNWSMFGAVLPLFVAGLLWSAWRPLAVRLTAVFGRRAPMFEPAPTSGTMPLRPNSVRPTVALHAMAVGLLAISLIAFHEDPLLAQIGTALPTYLGVRTVAQDVRTHQNLLLAIEAMDRYRADLGTYRGFDAAAAGVMEPRLAWTERASVATEPLWMWIATARTDVARVAGLSGSGTAFCIQRSAGGLTYGESHATGAMKDRLHAAVQTCGTTPWSPTVLRTPPFETMCDGLDPTGGYLICRMVQVLSVDILRQTKPEGVVG
jgi:hypothetical protein